MSVLDARIAQAEPGRFSYYPLIVDFEAVGARGIKRVNAPGRGATAVAEFTLGMILSLTRGLTVGQVGYGGIGGRLPALLAPSVAGCSYTIPASMRLRPRTVHCCRGPASP